MMMGIPDEHFRHNQPSLEQMAPTHQIQTRLPPLFLDRYCPLEEAQPEEAVFAEFRVKIDAAINSNAPNPLNNPFTLHEHL